MAKEDIFGDDWDSSMEFQPGRGAELLGAMVRLDAWVTRELRGKWRADMITRWMLFGFFAIGLYLDCDNWSKDTFTVVTFLSSLFFTILAGYLIVDKQKRRP